MRSKSWREMPFCTAAAAWASTMTGSFRKSLPRTPMRSAVRSMPFAVASTDAISTSGSSRISRSDRSAARSARHASIASRLCVMMTTGLSAALQAAAKSACFCEPPRP